MLIFLNQCLNRLNMRNFTVANIILLYKKKSVFFMVIIENVFNFLILE